MTDNTNSQNLQTKVPQITFYFWVLKFLTTAMGESTSDFLVFHINPFVAVGLGAIGFAAALVLQFRVQRYIPWVYWLAALMVAVFGTMAADVVHVVLGVPYLASTAFFAFALAFIFVAWYASEKTLSIHSIFTFRREVFYWAAVSATFALGTAAGDLTATTFGLGYFSSGILFALLIAVVAISYGISKIYPGGVRSHRSRNAVIAYWSAYVLTRPLGASFADWMDKPVSVSGLGWGDARVSVYLFIFIIFFVWYLTIRWAGANGKNAASEDESQTTFQAK